MKFLWLLFFLSLAAAIVSAQNPSDPQTAPASDIEIIGQSWSMKIAAPALAGNSSKTTFDRDAEIRARREATQSDSLRLQNRSLADAKTNPLDDAEDDLMQPPAPPTAIYVYEAKIKNNSDKQIRLIEWDYIFFAPGTSREIGRRKFSSRQKISAGKTEKLKMQSPSPPTGTINAADAGKNPGLQYDEKILIQRIEYANGTNWKLNK